MNIDLTGKRALVCGSTQGIGRATAMELALLGASVTLVARKEDRLQEVIRHLPADDTESHHYIVADFSQPERLKAGLDEYLKDHQIDILINNTGGPAAGPVLDAAPGEFTEAFTQHIICNQILVQAVVPGMKESGWGRIINVISTSVKAPLKGLGVSNTIRAAVANWAKTLAFELGPSGITVNNVLPSTAMTGRLQALIKNRSDKEGKTLEQVEKEMISEIPVGKIGTPEQVAAAIAFLATPAADYISGINLPVDGGKTPNL
jgi:3-oxoacyl-[acyl-carrier protein] reductase